MRVVILVFLSSLYMMTDTQGQDLHFSNNKFSPLLFNPAQTGLFNNTLRVGVTIRDQFKSFIANPYQSASFWIDSPVIHGLTERQWIGIGISGFVDKVGDLGQRTNGATISAAYHIALDKKNSRIISAGFQIGSTQRKFADAQNANFEDVSAGEKSQDISLLQNDASSISSLNISMVYQQQMSKKSNIEIGIAIIHANAPSFTISGSSASNSIPRRINVNTRLRLELNESFSLTPTIAASFMGKAHNIQLQCFTEIKIDRENKFSLTPGIGYRYGDAMQLHLGGIYDQWHLGVSYDVTLSTAAQFNQNRGGLEIGVIKYIDIEKKPTVDPIIFCPRL